MAVERDAFLLAVTGHKPAQDAARAVVSRMGFDPASATWRTDDVFPP